MLVTFQLTVDLGEAPDAMDLLRYHTEHHTVFQLCPLHSEPSHGDAIPAAAGSPYYGTLIGAKEAHL